MLEENKNNMPNGDIRESFKPIYNCDQNNFFGTTLPDIAMTAPVEGNSISTHAPYTPLSLETIPKIDTILSKILSKTSYINFKKKAYPKPYNQLLSATEDEEDFDLMVKIRSIKLSEEDKGIILAEEVKRITRNLGHDIMTTPNRWTYLYNGVYWDAIDESQVKHFWRESLKKMGEDRLFADNIKNINRIHDQCVFSLGKIIPSSNTDIKINCLNTTLRLTKGEVKEMVHNSDDHLFYTLPFSYDPTASSVLWSNFLDEVLPDKNVQQVLKEFIGCCLDKSIKLEKVLCCVGTGSNGKSVFMEAISGMLGKKNVSSYNMSSLCDDKGYSRVKIKDTLLNYSSDFNGKIWNNGIFKQLASGEPVEARKLYSDPEIIENYARLAFNTNSMPTSSDMSAGFRRRLLLIPFETKISKEKADPKLANKLMTELPSILNWAISGLQQFIANGYKLSYSEKLDSVDNDYKEESDSLTLFLRDSDYRPSGAERMRVSTLHGEYMKFCKDRSLAFENRDRKSTRLNSSHIHKSRMPSSA